MALFGHLQVAQAQQIGPRYRPPQVLRTAQFLKRLALLGVLAGAVHGMGCERRTPRRFSIRKANRLVRGNRCVFLVRERRSFEATVGASIKLEAPSAIGLYLSLTNSLAASVETLNKAADASAYRTADFV